MLNLNLSLLTLTFIFLLVSYYFVFFKYSMISFLLPSVRSRKRMQKYYTFIFLPNFLATIFQKIFTFSVTTLIIKEIFFRKKLIFFNHLHLFLFWLIFFHLLWLLSCYSHLKHLPPFLFIFSLFIILPGVLCFLLKKKFNFVFY